MRTKVGLMVASLFTLFLIAGNDSHQQIDNESENECNNGDQPKQCQQRLGNRITIPCKYDKRSNQELQWLKFIEEAENDYHNEQNQDNQMAYTKLIADDLSPFVQTGITKDMIQRALIRGVLYQIRDHKLYRSNSCNFPARCSGVEHFILQLINELVDMELIINVSDWPQINSFVREPFPVFSFSKTGEYFDIMFPAWTFWEGGPALSIYPTGIGRWDVQRKTIIEASQQVPWEKKVNKGFFRGSRTSSERDPLILLSRKDPAIVDAQYTKNQAWKSDKDTLGLPAAQEVKFEDHCHYKYLFNYRGVAASFRFKHLFLCKSLVFQVGSDWMEFFYPLLKPWYHYIPIDSSATSDDIRSLIEFANSNDVTVSKIAQRGFDWVDKNLQMTNISQYWKQLLGAYGKLLTYKIEEIDGLIQIS